MPQTMREVMTPNPVNMSTASTVIDAARMMREKNIGDVICHENGRLCGMVTDRDIVIRCIAEGRNPQEMKLGELCSRKLITVTPNDTVDHAIGLMREKAVRRVIVEEAGKAVGIVSLGDLAVIRDRHSVLGEISAAKPNR